MLKYEELILGYGTPDDFLFKKTFLKNYNEMSGEPIEDIYKLDDELEDLIYERNPKCAAMIGGYPVFSQYDPREGSLRLGSFNRVLFELFDLESDEVNSWGGHDYEIIWGDVGTGSFLIPADKLKECDFSAVLYNYDCG